MKTSKQIRQEFISFFESKEHYYVRSSPVIPSEDPTLLFINAGMNQFKDVFLGTGTRTYSRAANSQKCIRASGKHNDLEDVGRDNYHHTFFEMLGNWSFGDYFKQDAIVWAWELLVEQWGLPKEKMWATVFEGVPSENLEPDDEAAELWKTQTDINPKQILRCSKKDNFWEMGDVGPCGPCSELHIDLGEGTCPLHERHHCGVNVDGCWRFIELWNLVFMQFNRLPSGKLENLPDCHVDTGMGLERICRVLQAVDSNYSTDLFTPILAEIAKITGKSPHETGEIGVAFRVVADHLRSLSFAIADGAIPSNENRGYVLRRMLRRATRFGRVLGMEKPFIHQLVPTLVEIMGEAFPELRAQEKHVAGVIRAEEESFGQTLDRGLDIFEQMVGQSTTHTEKRLAGSEAFKLYDTYGFPVDLTRLLCEERGWSVDEAAFVECMEEQRTKAREAAKFKRTLDSWTLLSEGNHSQFVGYQTFLSNSIIRRYAQNEAGQWLIVLDRTPFYAESGGQVADQGTLKQGAVQWKVVDVRKEGDAIIHVCEGVQTPADGSVTAEIDRLFRASITTNHTATHLLQSALKGVLGNHVHQAGSVVHPDYLRFDFTHFEKPSEEQLERIENRVNQEIRNNTPLEIYETGYDQALEKGATALFSEKYGDRVRVVNIPGFSTELCGGCHVQATGEIGYFRITSEGAIASGVRRIVAVTGKTSAQMIREEGKAIQELRQLLNTSTEKLPGLLHKLMEEKRQLEKDLQAFKKESASGDAAQLVSQAQTIEGVQVLVCQVAVDHIDTLKSLGDSLREKLKPGIAILASEISDKVTLLCVVSEDLVAQKLKAGDLVNLVAAVADGRGGGKPHLAQAGVKAPEKLLQALQQAPSLIQSYLRERL
ncbi:alanine--tRNA ligase [Deltaproteobacteria bacterium TL4]